MASANYFFMIPKVPVFLSVTVFWVNLFLHFIHHHYKKGVVLFIISLAVSMCRDA